MESKKLIVDTDEEGVDLEERQDAGTPAAVPGSSVWSTLTNLWTGPGERFIPTIYKTEYCS